MRKGANEIGEAKRLKISYFFLCCHSAVRILRNLSMTFKKVQWRNGEMITFASFHVFVHMFNVYGIEGDIY